MFKRTLALALAAMAGIAAPASHQAVINAAPIIQRKNARRHSGGGGFVAYWGYSKGPGWSAAHVQRMAKKRRNILRNKKAKKGGAA